MNKISVAMIVRDESENIERSINSANKIATEIVVVDTGSKDNTVEIIKAMKNDKIKLYFKEWNNNFSEARNYSIEKCTQEYIFILDADEELSAGLIEDINNTTLYKDVYSLTSANFLDAEHTLYDTIVQPRIFAKGNISYIGAIHNQAVYHIEDGNLTTLSSNYLHHYGYVWTDILRAKKTNRTTPLLIEEIQHHEGTNKMYFQVQLFKSYLIGQQMEEALACGNSLIQDFFSAQQLPAIAYEFFVLFGLLLLEQHEADLSASCFMKAKEMLPSCSDAYLGLAMCFLNTQKYIAGIFEIEDYYKNLNNVDFPITISGRKYEDIANVVASMLYLKSGDIQKAKIYLQKTKHINKSFEVVRYLSLLYTTITTQICDSTLKELWGELKAIFEDAEIDVSLLDYNRVFTQGVDVVPLKKRIVFMCQKGQETFIKPIRDYFSKQYATKLILPESTDEIKAGLKYGDIIWLEWGNEISAACSNEKLNKPMILRILSYEAYNPQLLKKINWANISTTIFAANFIKEIVEKNVTVKNSVLIQNGIDTDKYIFNEKPAGKKVGFVGNFNSIKNPQMFIQIAHQVIQQDKDYKFYWAGHIQDVRLFYYVQMMVSRLGLENNVFFEPFTNDVNTWLNDKDIYLSSSCHEAYGVSILEALSKGLTPVLHNFYYAEEFYPKQYLFNTVQQGAAMILGAQYNQKEYRAFAMAHSMPVQMEQIKKVFNNLM